MAEHSTIEWTDATWNPITGCSVVSPGCTNCYAMRLAGARLKHHPSRTGLTQDSKAGPVWTGEVRFNDAWLEQPLRWRRPRRIFVCAHGDLFHESVPWGWIHRVFAVMRAAPQHVFQVLTKRPERMREFVATYYGRVLPNVWIGISAEDQRRADERMPHLLETPAAVRFVSAEPLLGPIVFRQTMHAWRNHPTTEWLQSDTPELDWIIVGGESGPRARNMDPAWARSIRDQCREAGIKFFFKQMSRKGTIPEDLQIREFPDAIH